MTLKFTSDSELEVLKALWEIGPATVRDLHGPLQESGSSWAYTTVQTLLARLEQKGYVRCDKSGRAHVFEEKPGHLTVTEWLSGLVRTARAQALVFDYVGFPAAMFDEVKAGF